MCEKFCFCLRTNWKQFYDYQLILYMVHRRITYVNCSVKVLVAAKTVYFGVGGGVRQFEEVVRKEGLNVETVMSYEEGVKREILKIVL